jgi:kynurenine formamidase
MKKYIDLSHPFNSHMPIYPGDEALELQRIKSFENDGHTNFRFKTSLHTGTHIDGPMHMTTSRQFIGDISIERLIGTGCLLNVDGENNILRKVEYESILMPDTIVVIRTGFGEKYGSEEYFAKHPTVSIELAQLFVKKRVKMICIDTPSPDSAPYPVHTLLLENRILIAENLINLEKLLDVQQFEIIALPLRILADSSPARIIARTLE